MRHIKGRSPSKKEGRLLQIARRYLWFGGRGQMESWVGEDGVRDAFEKHRHRMYLSKEEYQTYREWAVRTGVHRG